MKRFYFLVISYFMTSLMFAQYNIEDVNLNGQDFKKITGTINSDETLDNSSLWIISGLVFVDQQTTLTITEGTQIFAETTDTRLEVNQLGSIDCQGTSTNPIVFNSLANAPNQGAGDNSPGQWSGIEIVGSGGTGNSGIMKYVRMMYAGSDDDALQFTNVGDGTTIEYIQVYQNNDNGFRINDGTVNLKYIISTNSNDAGVRGDDGWNGSGQFWVVNKNINGGNAIEIRGGVSTLSNVTVTGIGLNDPVAAPAGDGIRIRNEGNCQIHNTVVTGVDRSMRFSDDSQQGIIDGTSFFRNSASFDNDANNGTGFHSSASIFNPTDSDYDPAFNNSVVPFTIVDSYVGTSTLNSSAAGPIDPSFTDVNYIGAVQSSNDWTLGWTVDLDGNLLSANDFETPEITIYPNPVEDILFINTKSNISSVEIFNTLGKKVYDIPSFQNNDNQINMTQFESGIYFIKVEDGNSSQTLKIIKK